MKRTILCVVLLQLSFFPVIRSQHIISEKYSLSMLEELIIPHGEWEPFPKIANRAGWEKANQTALEAYIEEAGKYLDYAWPVIPATSSLLIVRTGNRSEYQRISYEKRTVLCTLLLAEIAENKGRFTDQIVNGIWSVCEESWWGVPAHLPKSAEYAGLMDVSNPFVDLFAAETGTYLAWADYFLGDKFDEISPQIRKRIYREVDYRLMQPLMTKSHGWMTKTPNGRGPNNWNPWICSNWINFVLLLEKNQQRRVEMVAKALQTLDEFLNPYPQDGGCDEGPGYWGAAAASLYDNISLLNLATSGAFGYLFGDEKIQNMGKYIYRMHIGGAFFLNFADASPTPRMPANLIFNYGKDINDRTMMEFGAYFSGKEVVGTRSHFIRTLLSLFNRQDINSVTGRVPLLRDVWLPDLQVMASRDTGHTEKGFYLAAKGGCNDESHNHNDVGNYVIYADGQPLIIDPGSGTYTARTFGNRRYDLWFNCSDYHNLPTINGYTQSAGRRFAATDVHYGMDEWATRFSLDLKDAYDPEAGIVFWKRTIEHNRGKEIRITDNYKLNYANGITEYIMTCHPCEVQNGNQVVIRFSGKDGVVTNYRIQCSSGQMNASVEEIKLDSPEDRGIRNNWNDRVYRIRFEEDRPQREGVVAFVISEL